MMLPIWAGLYYASQYVQYNGNATKAGLIAQAIGWVSQFYGHGVHEGRAPAVSSFYARYACVENR